MCAHVTSTCPDILDGECRARKGSVAIQWQPVFDNPDIEAMLHSPVGQVLWPKLRLDEALRSMLHLLLFLHF
jgi:hypothetical protein